MDSRSKSVDYTCVICKFTTTTSLALESHLKTHIHEQSVYLCPHCEFTSNRPCNVVAHMKIHVLTNETEVSNNFLTAVENPINSIANNNGKKVVQNHAKTNKNCLKIQIDKKSRSKGNKESNQSPSVLLKDKTISCTGSLVCHICEKSFRTPQTLKCHVRLHIKNKRKCSKCDFVCDKKKLMRLHMKIHDGKKYPCEHCPEIFPTNKGKKQHMKLFHKDLMLPCVCKICGYSCEKDGSMQKHILRSHRELYKNKKKLPKLPLKALYTCSYCGYSCYYRTNHLQHVRTHTGERPYKCTLCNYAAAQSSSLSLHMKCHSDERPFKCIHCQASFKVSSHLSKHLKTHLNSGRFQCEVCEKKFLYKHNMERHRLLHQKNLKCEFCNKVFLYSNAYKVHLKCHKDKQISVCENKKPRNKSCRLQKTKKKAVVHNMPYINLSTDPNDYSTTHHENLDDTKENDLTLNAESKDIQCFQNVDGECRLNENVNSNQSTQDKTEDYQNFQNNREVNQNLGTRENIFDMFSNVFGNSIDVKFSPENISANVSVNECASDLQNAIFQDISVKIEPESSAEINVTPETQQICHNNIDNVTNEMQMTKKSNRLSLTGKIMTALNKVKLNRIVATRNSQEKLKSPPCQTKDITKVSGGKNSNQQFMCPTCDMKFKCKKEFKTHRKLHKELQPYTCNYCKETFPFKTSLKLHVVATHSTNGLSKKTRRGRKKRKANFNEELAKEKISIIDHVLSTKLVPLIQDMETKTVAVDISTVKNEVNDKDQCYEGSQIVRNHGSLSRISCVDLLKPYIKAYPVEDEKN